MHLMPYTKLSAISEVKQDNNNLEEGPNSYQDEGLDSGDFDDDIPETPANLAKNADISMIFHFFRLFIYFRMGLYNCWSRRDRF